MRRAKDLIGKAIVHQATGERLASAYDLVFTPDTRNVSAIVVDSGGWFRDAKVVPWSAIASIGDVIIVQGDKPIMIASDSPALQQDLQNNARITGVSIVTATGERIGAVGDLFINDRGNVLGYEVKQGFVSDLAGRKFLAAENVQSVGKDAIIATTSELQSLKSAVQELGATSEQGDERAV